MFEVYYCVLICISLQNVAGINVKRLDHDIIGLPDCGKYLVDKEKCWNLARNSKVDGNCQCLCPSGYSTYMDPSIERINKSILIYTNGPACVYDAFFISIEGCTEFKNYQAGDKPIIIDLSQSSRKSTVEAKYSKMHYEDCNIGAVVRRPGFGQEWTSIDKIDFNMTANKQGLYIISWELRDGANTSAYSGLIIKLQLTCPVHSQDTCIMAKTKGTYHYEPALPVTTTKQPQSETTTMKTTSFSKSTAKQLIKTPVINTSLITSGTFENTNSWPFVPSTFVTTKAPYKHPMAPSSRTGALSVPILAIIICICVLFVILVVLIVCFYQRTSRKRHSKDGAVELSVHEGSSTDSAITEPSSPIQTTIKEPETAEQPPCVSEPYYSSVNKRRKNNVKLNEPIPDEGTDDVENQIDMRNDIEASMNDERVIIEVNPIYGSLDSLTVN